METSITRVGSVAAPDPIASGFVQSNRIMPCEPAPVLSDTVAGETTVIIHELEGDEKLHGVTAYLRSSGIVYRAMQVLQEWEYLPARISSSSVPVDIIALKKNHTLLIQVISSKKPVPDANTLSRLYGKKIQDLRMMGTTSQFKKLVMVYSQKSGWKYYEVLPGGLLPAWNLPEGPEK